MFHGRLSAQSLVSMCPSATTRPPQTARVMTRDRPPPCFFADARAPQVAIKKISRAFDDPIDAQRMLREIKLQRQFDHDNLINIVEILPPPSLRTSEWQDVYVVSDLMETDLHEMIYSRQSLSSSQIQYFVYQILRALKYVHSASVLHLDLKPNNSKWDSIDPIVRPRHLAASSVRPRRHARAPVASCASGGTRGTLTPARAWSTESLVRVACARDDHSASLGATARVLVLVRSASQSQLRPQDLRPRARARRLGGRRGVEGVGRVCHHSLVHAASCRALLLSCITPDRLVCGIAASSASPRTSSYLSAHGGGRASRALAFRRRLIVAVSSSPRRRVCPCPECSW